jgi:hypothetical protein
MKTVLPLIWSFIPTVLVFAPFLASTLAQEVSIPDPDIIAFK